jgi:biopolymer transport protein ExbD
MITRPLDLASKLSPPPRSFDVFFYVNVGLLALFFSVFGSRFVLAPGLGVEFQLPRMAGAEAGARQTTHVISVLPSGQIFAGDGLMNLPQLREWLKTQAGTVPHPVLLVRASAGVTGASLTEITSAARGAGFGVVLAVEDPETGAAREGAR